MGTEVIFVVPGAPQGKGRHRACIRGGRVATYTPTKTANYESLVALTAQAAMRGLAPIDGPCIVEMEILVAVPASWSAKKSAAALAGTIRPTNKPDIDNVEKAIFDGINGIVWRDDSQVVEVRKRKRYAETPCVRVSVVEIDV